MSSHPPHLDATTHATTDPTSHGTVEAEPAPRPDSDVIARGRVLLDQGQAEAALQCLRPSFDSNRAQAQVRSYYGLAIGLARGRYHEALDLCQSAVKQEFFNPDLYLNVARLNLAFGFKTEALRYLRRAKMIDPANPSIRGLFEKLGFRSEPVLRFLPRRHLLNRWLGGARSALARSAPWSEVEPHATSDHIAA